MLEVFEASYRAYAEPSARRMSPLFDRSDVDPLQRRAETLLGTATAIARNLLSSLAAGHRVLFRVEEERWAFLVTAAGLYVASFELHGRVQGDRFVGLYEIVRRDLPAGLAEAMANCSDYVTRTAGPQCDPHTFETVLGYWVLWHALSGRPSQEEAELAYLIGHTLADAFHTWWTV